MSPERGHTFCAFLRKTAQSKPMSRFHRSHFIQKFTGKMPRPSTTAQTLCEPAQSRRTSRFHKSHFTPKLTGKMPRPRLSPDCRHTLCASLRRRNACQDFTRATSHGNLQEKCRAPDCARNADTHFVRACAGETHVKISQEPLYSEKKWEKCRAPDWARNADTHFVRACAVEMHVHMSQKTLEEPLYTEIYRKNAWPRFGPRT